MRQQVAIQGSFHQPAAVNPELPLFLAVPSERVEQVVAVGPDGLLVVVLPVVQNVQPPTRVCKVSVCEPANRWTDSSPFREGSSSSVPCECTVADVVASNTVVYQLVTQVVQVVSVGGC